MKAKTDKRNEKLMKALEISDSVCTGLVCATPDCEGIITGEHIECGTPLCARHIERGQCFTCEVLTDVEDKVLSIKEETFSNGTQSVEVSIGSRFRRDGVVWQLARYLGRDHSFTTGSAPAFACMAIEGEPPRYATERYAEDGMIVFNTDSMMGRLITITE